MPHPRELIPASEEYLRALGRALYNFAYLEWGVVWLAETIERGFLCEVSNLTAGQIARRFSTAAKELADETEDKTAIMEVAEKFMELVEDRNRLLHGNPFTASCGEQRLQYTGRHGRKDWTIERMAEFADRVADASIETSRLLHGGHYKAWLKDRVDFA